MGNERLRSTIAGTTYSYAELAEELGVDAKTVERWVSMGRVPHRQTAARAARILGVSASWLWPELDRREPVSHSELVAYYPHRSEVPKTLWLDLLTKARREIVLLAYASLFLPEENPETIAVVRAKVAQGVRVRVGLGDPDSPETKLRTHEER